MSYITNKHKWGNLYDVNGNLIKKGPLKNYTIEETEKLVDELSEKAKENPEDKALFARLNNATQWLIGLYNRYGNPHRDEIMEKIKAAANKNVTVDEISNALTAVRDELIKEENNAEQLGNKESGDVGDNVSGEPGKPESVTIGA